VKPAVDRWIDNMVSSQNQRLTVNAGIVLLT